mmetsp:Transcript_44378/g.32431  ORF Transcript_44378/g.32431 Transcript_44378/m.32431 type:complete len:337 (+) Transcript_44378:1439-2449(+)|eukprot:CAMPEP_0202961162 /NCGR_PEP_ID=MMETSP1396-20130829/5218_1 /ASSEMBLY_ACC=CAM_ASM_000872 /TAXON_ID= /ORGANISM="Pseudokeronopsis sp., Strain Brazil" /LENGTH=336 /DNA_ID=CAMNT_0049680779 /DNA_START=1351 /DNA_END=2361 /DNA_ORIENTATION=+
MLLAVIPFLVSIVVIFGLLWADSYLWKVAPEWLHLPLMILVPLVLIFFNYQVVPYIVFGMVQVERHELKSEKERSFLQKNLLFMILNSLILPFLSFVSITYLHDYPDVIMPDTPKPSKPIHPPANSTVLNATALSLTYLNLSVEPLNFRFAEIISYSQFYYISYLFELILIMILYQLLVSPEKILKAFHQMLSANGKIKFKHWVYDLGFKYSVFISLFIFALFFSVIVPIFLPLCTLIFTLAYYFDKYNLIYIYPVDFDSRTIYRKVMLTHSLFGIFLFQVFVYSVCGSVLNKKLTAYLFAYLLIQLMILFTLFEFVRSPWDGKEQEVEKIQNLQQ